MLDVGCGTGASTRRAARVAVRGRALGVDLSTRMLAHARERARQEGVANAEFVRADAQVHPFQPGASTTAISAFGTMFFADPVAAFANIRRALAPGGRLTLLVWRRFDDNEWFRTVFTALDAGRSLPTPTPGRPGPFGLAERARLEHVLDASGWHHLGIEPLDEPVWLGANADEAWTFVRGFGIVRGLTGGLDDDDRRRALDTLRAVIARFATADGVMLGSAAWLVRAAA